MYENLIFDFATAWVVPLTQFTLIAFVFDFIRTLFFQPVK